MSRAAVYDAIVGDDDLNALGFNGDTVFPNFDGDGRPTPTGPFIIIRWEESSLYSRSYTGMSNGINRAPRTVTIWVHFPCENTSDFSRIDQALDLIDSILTSMEHVIGGDGMTVTCINKSGRSSDMKDPGYNTITRNAAYGVLSRPTP